MSKSSLAETLCRWILRGLTRLLYRVRVQGADAIPAKGPALLVANHLSLADGFLVGLTVQRPVRFLIWRPYYETRPWHWFLRILRAIPISDKDSPKEILRSLMVARKALDEGEVVCIFAEGQISRTGNLLEFKKGFEIIVKGMDVPVFPVNLDRVWGSIFSFEHGKVIFKKPRQIPYPVTVTVGAPLRSPITASQVRQAVLDLSADAFQHRLSERSSLALEFLKRAKRQSRVLAVADSSGQELSFASLASTSLVFSRVLNTVLPVSQTAFADGAAAAPARGESGVSAVGLLLPSSLAGAIANVGVLLAGRIPVNLNYTAGIASVRTAIEKAGITRLITSRKLLEKTGLPALPGTMYIEDLLERLSKPAMVRERFFFSLLPQGAMLRRFGKYAAPDAGQVATIMFSSGSTGLPKGVVLTHRNILANVLALSQVFDVGKKDRMIGILPFFHSFGFTATLWFPLIAGFSAVYHSNPLDAKKVGELAGQYKATLLLATPTFLTAYIRKCTRDQFASLRFVITGAERLRESVALAFEEKFGKIPLEGYGCTELSPVATVNVPNVSMGEVSQVGHKNGMIGHPIPGVSVRIVDPETFEARPQGEKGLLLVKGQNVMQGYLGEPEKTAAVIHEGWYVTGDIARLDHDGFVQIVDRLSRFSKIGGEMVPHVLIEEKLNQLAGCTEPRFTVSAVPDEKRGEQLVVLYVPSTRPPVAGQGSEGGLNSGDPPASVLPPKGGGRNEVDSLIKQLQSSDLPKLWIPASEHFYPIDAIPYLGTGKLDLVKVRAIALQASQSNDPSSESGRTSRHPNL